MVMVLPPALETSLGKFSQSSFVSQVLWHCPSKSGRHTWEHDCLYLSHIYIIALALHLPAEGPE